MCLRVLCGYKIIPKTKSLEEHRTARNYLFSLGNSVEYNSVQFVRVGNRHLAPAEFSLGGLDESVVVRVNCHYRIERQKNDVSLRIAEIHAREHSGKKTSVRILERYPDFDCASHRVDDIADCRRLADKFLVRKRGKHDLYIFPFLHFMQLGFRDIGHQPCGLGCDGFELCED